MNTVISAMKLDLSHCTAEYRCWEHWQPARRVMQVDIDAAYDLLRALVSIKDPSLEHAINVRIAAVMYDSLVGDRWRQMTREPFWFAYRKLNMARSKINPTISKTDPKQLLEELRLI